MESLKVIGDSPQARFGHTITLVSKTKAVLFGGATGDTGKYSITGDTFLFDCLTRKWKKLEPSGSSPTPRAAHSATTVENNQLVIYGGATGGGQLAPDDLYLLDLRSGEEQSQWIVVPVVGTTPGRRYGHSIVFSKPFLVVYGGNTGNEPVNDVWTLNVEKAPLFWTKLEIESEAPSIRVYHAAALCSTGTANGMMVIFGGRTVDQHALNDTWGLRRHRNGKWDWVKAPYKSGTETPTARYQHSTLFMGSLMFVVGGRTNNVGEVVPLEVYDCESSEWMRFQPIQRFRHSCWILENHLYVHGGFEQDSPNIPTELITKVDVSKYFQNTNNSNLYKQQQLNQQQQMNQSSKGASGNLIGTPNMSSSSTTKQNGGGQGMQQSMNNYDQSGAMINENSNNPNKDSLYRDYNPVKQRKPNTANQNSSQPVRISEKVVIAVSHNAGDDPTGLIRQVSIDKLPEESKKIKFGVHFQDPNAYTSQNQVYYESIYGPFLNTLLKVNKEWQPSNDYRFPFKREQILRLIDESMKLIDSQPMMLNLRVPAKIYGSIHGQYGDLLRLFTHWGGPSENGDIDSFDYIFLGNYVDRGKYNLEVLCLLLSLKLKYPDQFHLLRGAHEDIKINQNYGFGDECGQRLNENIYDSNSVFARFNKLFEYLPLAAVVENKILCVHSGIGQSLRFLEDIESLQRPFEIVAEPTRLQHQMIIDLLWSDPELESGSTTPNKTIPVKGATKYDDQRLKQFLGENNLTMVIRSHECVMDGFERSSNGMVMTVFSASDYCGKFNNSASVVVIKKSFELVPKVIYPLSEDPNSYNKNGSRYGSMMNSNNKQLYWADNEEALKKRPPTPPRISGKSTGYKKM